MLKVSFNVTDQIQALRQCKSLGSSGSISFLRPSAVVSFSPVRMKGKTLVQVVVSNQQGGLTRVDSGLGSLADRLRLGSLTEYALSYKEKFIVRCYEVGNNKAATVETFANLLQDVGCNHAQSVEFSTNGFATTSIIRKLHLIWVTAHMHIKVYKYPACDVIEIETWCQVREKLEPDKRLDSKGLGNWPSYWKGYQMRHWLPLFRSSSSFQSLLLRIAVSDSEESRGPTVIVGTHIL